MPFTASVAQSLNQVFYLIVQRHLRLHTAKQSVSGFGGTAAPCLVGLRSYVSRDLWLCVCAHCCMTLWHCISSQAPATKVPHWHPHTTDCGVFCPLMVKAKEIHHMITSQQQAANREEVSLKIVCSDNSGKHCTRSSYMTIILMWVMRSQALNTSC